MKQKWIKKDGNQFERITEDPVDADKTQLSKFNEDPNPDSYDKKIIEQYKKRKHLNIKPIKSFKVTKGTEFTVEIKELETELTTEMLRSGDWKNKEFKNYNFGADPTIGMGGHCHPLMQVRE